MQGLKSAILAIFQRGPRWSCPVSVALKNPSLDLKNSFCFEFLRIPSNAGRQNLKVPFVQSDEITVCSVWCMLL